MQLEKIIIRHIASIFHYINVILFNNLYILYVRAPI